MLYAGLLQHPWAYALEIVTARQGHLLSTKCFLRATVQHRGFPHSAVVWLLIAFSGALFSLCLSNLSFNPCGLSLASFSKDFLESSAAQEEQPLPPLA